MKRKKNFFTDFFVELEKKWLEEWEEKGIVKKYIEKNNDSKERYSFQDGPITANNPMGVHHAWGRTYKDLWQRFYNLKGKKQRFQNGFDCQGLWVEVEVEKELNLKSKKDIENLIPGDKKASVAKFVQMCKDRVNKYAGIQTKQSKRLGYFMDWDHSYYTMSEDNNYMIWHFLKECYKKGWLYKGHESVPWCPRCETAISQHEMLTEDYKEVVHDSIYMEFKLEDAKDEYLLVWTTTPWTIPANIAVAVDKDIEYSLVEGMSGDKFWLAKDLIPDVFGEDYKKIIKTVKGTELEGRKYTGLFDDLEVVKKTAEENPETFHRVILTDSKIMPISTTEGTGLVHTAVSAGTEDFKLGKKLNLPMIPVIADNADYLPHMGFLAGKNAKLNPNIIFDYLKEEEKKGKNYIFEIRKYKHRYPGCWRCKSELVWKVADEWYISMDKSSKSDSDDTRTLRERMIDVAKKIKWMPAFGLDRELDWLNNMHDWLISKKNRYWGLALPIYECADCKNFEVIGSKEELKERAVSGWDQFQGKTPHKPYIDDVLIECKKCGKKMKRIGDVGNPWLDAGIVPYSTIKENNIGEPLYLKNRKEWQEWFPVDFITESFPGQFKNWFYAMIAMSTVLEDVNPFKQVLGFATLLDEKGRPMHKSWGNSIAFHEGADEIGVDVMRWLFARQNPAENLLFGYNKADEVRRQFHILLWNIFKFYRQNAEVDGRKYKKLNLKYVKSDLVLDKWIIDRLKEVINLTDKSLLDKKTKPATEALEEFLNDLSTWYVRRSRDRVGTAAQDTNSKNNFYDTIELVLVNLTIVLAPFIPFLSEEIYTQITGNESVHLENWPDISSSKINHELVSDTKIVREIVEIAHRVRKDEGIKVRQPLAKVKINLPKAKEFNLEENIKQYKELIASEVNVKNVEFDKSKEDISVEYDTHLTEDLKLEGELRDLIRDIQNKRKKLGISPKEKVKIVIDQKFKDSVEDIKIQVQAKEVEFGQELAVKLL